MPLLYFVVPTTVLLWYSINEEEEKALTLAIKYKNQ